MLKYNFISEIRNRTALIMGCPFLLPLNARERNVLLSFCHSRDYRAGETIYESGDPATGLYFIVSGKVRIQTLFEQQTVSTSLGSPEVFGVLGLTQDSARMATARAETDAQLLGFFRSDFETLRERNPRLGLRLFQLLHKVAVIRLDEFLSVTPPKPSEIKPSTLRFELLPENFEKSIPS